ncbi:MAG TPA: hypothetical protein VFB97_00520, partial [Bacteroidales bacterium]|nr:hypothetical protein [Bacteroidales bacterium]
LNLIPYIICLIGFVLNEKEMKRRKTDNTRDLFAGRYMVWFFAGGESRDDKFNVFTGSFIRFMRKILGEDFELVKGIYFSMPMMNVAWALNNSQLPISEPRKNWITEVAMQQMIHDRFFPDTRLVIVSSSSGSVVAAQVACYLAERNRDWLIFQKPFDLALGATMISKESEIYRNLIEYQKKGIIGKIIYDDLQDEGDSSNGIGGTSRRQAWANAFGLMFPYFSRKFSSPSFLNTHPLKGHLHRQRSQTIQKALDFVEVILVKHNLAGDHYQEKAKLLVAEESLKLLAEKMPEGNST